MDVNIKIALTRTKTAACVTQKWREFDTILLVSMAKTHHFFLLLNWRNKQFLSGTVKMSQRAFDISDPGRKRTYLWFIIACPYIELHYHHQMSNVINAIKDVIAWKLIFNIAIASYCLSMFSSNMLMLYYVKPQEPYI